VNRSVTHQTRAGDITMPRRGGRPSMYARRWRTSSVQVRLACSNSRFEIRPKVQPWIFFEQFLHHL